MRKISVEYMMNLPPSQCMHIAYCLPDSDQYSLASMLWRTLPKVSEICLIDEPRNVLHSEKVENKDLFP